MKLSDAIVIVMLAVPVLRYSVAFQQAEPALLTPWGELDISFVTGLAFGISYEAAIYYGLREGTAARQRGRKTWWWPVVGALLQIAIGTIIVVPMLVANLNNRPLPDVLGTIGGWAWSIAVAVASLLCFVTITVSLAIQPKKKVKKEVGTCKVCTKRFLAEQLEKGKCSSCIKSSEGKTHALPLELSISVLDRDDWVCYYCGIDLRNVPSGKRHIDHFIPKSKDGLDIVDNLVTACAKCNLSKSNNMPDEVEREKFTLYLKAKAAGEDKKSQILYLASLKNGNNSMKQKDIASLLKVTQGYVSNILKDMKNISNNTMLEEEE